MPSVKEAVPAGVACICGLILWTIIMVASIGAIDLSEGGISDVAIANFEFGGASDMGRDWQQKTFTDINVTSSWCPVGWEHAYNRVFYGMQPGCDCLGVFSPNINTDD